MKDVFKARRVSDRVWWVGAIDWSVRDFHGYLTSRGTTYNAYLVLADRVTLFDAVKAPFQEELLARVASVIEPEKIDYVVSNHAEPDHTGCLAQVIRAVRPQKVFASVKGVEALDEHYGLGGALTPVQDGGRLSLGNMGVTFVETRMAHWPDSMVSYLHEEQMLISQDAFGMHLASYDRFDDEMDPCVLAYESAKYYANILLPLSGFVAKALEKVQALNVPLKIIAPDHGPVWRADPGRILADYARWARQERGLKAVVVYDTMWKSTELMARAIGEGLSAGGARPRLMPMSGNHRSDVATELLDAGALVVGAPTINNEIFPTVADVLTYIRGLKPKGLVGAAFGSYGWGGEATKDIRAVLEEMKVELVDEPLKVKYVPDAAALRALYELGLKVARRLAEKKT